MPKTKRTSAKKRPAKKRKTAPMKKKHVEEFMPKLQIALSLHGWRCELPTSRPGEVVLLVTRPLRRGEVVLTGDERAQLEPTPHLLFAVESGEDRGDWSSNECTLDDVLRDREVLGWTYVLRRPCILKPFPKAFRTPQTF